MNRVFRSGRSTGRSSARRAFGPETENSPDTRPVFCTEKSTKGIDCMLYRIKKQGIAFWLLLFCGGIFWGIFSLRTRASEPEETAELYRQYQAQFNALERVEDMEEAGYRILEEQVFPIAPESFGEEELTLIPAIDGTWRRLALFIADAGGRIRYKCNELETNECAPGEMRQLTMDIASIAFADVNHDQKTDIILITRCVNPSGSYAGNPYKVGDVLFQGDGTFYRDWRVSDKINRFSMNKSANYIITFVRDGKSAEFLYTAATLDELLAEGFTIIEEQCYTRDFEKLGRLRVVPGTVKISAYEIFMIYLVNEQGDIIWSFQPMGDYDSLYSLRSVMGRDVDGDGMKDLVVLARYSIEAEEQEAWVENRCAIYYQRTGGFDIDTEFEKTYQCRDEDTMEDLIRKIREYWGWQVEE